MALLEIPELDEDVLLALPEASYARLSVNHLGQSDSVANQEADTTEVSSARWPGRPLKYFHDDDKSASDPTVERPGFNDLVDAIESGVIGGIIATSQSRLVRNGEEYAKLRRVCLKAGITYWTFTSGGKGDVDIREAQALGPSIEVVVDAHYSEVAKVNTRRGLRTIAKAGKANGGVCFGYIRGPKPTKGGCPLIPDPDVRGVPQEIFDRVLAGEAILAIAKDLNRRGIPTARKGQLWRASNIRRMLSSPTLVGRRVYKGKVIGDGDWKPVVRPETYDAVQDLLRRQSTVVRSNGLLSQRGVPRLTPSKYLLSGIARCGRCGTTMTGTHRTGNRKPIYTCHSSRGGCDRVSASVDGADRVVERKFLCMLDTKAFRAGLNEEDPFAVRRVEIEEQLADLQVRRALDAEDEMEGRMSRATWLTRCEVLDAREAALMGERDGLPARQDRVDPDVIKVAWVGNTDAEKRQLIGLYAKVTIASATKKLNTFDEDRVKVRPRRLDEH